MGTLNTPPISPFSWAPEQNALPPGAASLPSPISLSLYSASLFSLGKDVRDGFLSSCTEIDRERRPNPPCALRGFGFISISYDLCFGLIEIRFSFVDSRTQDDGLFLDDFVTPWGVPNPSCLALKPSDSRAPSN